MEENVKKIFNILGVEPNEKFKIKFESGNISCAFFWLNEELRLFSEDEEIKYLDAMLFRLLNGKCKSVKPPKKKKLRDLTIEEFKKFKRKMCRKYDGCKGCPFFIVTCNPNFDGFWLNHKDLYSDKFLDQEVIIEEEE